MAKRIANTKDKKPAEKKGDIFQYIAWLTYDKKKWEDLSYDDKKYFSPFMLNKFLSMEYYFCEIINDLQEATCSMEKEMVWRLYYEMLPRQRVNIKFVKADTKEVPEKEILALQNYFNCNEEIASEYLSILKKKNLSLEEILDYQKKK